MRSPRLYRSLILFVALVCIIVVAYSFYLIISRPFDVRVLDVRYQVGEEVGLEINKSALTFGRVLPGTSATRSITLDNPYPFLVTVDVFIDRESSRYITTEYPRFNLAPSSSSNVSFSLSIPPSFPLGNYTGTLRFEFRR